MRVPLSWLAEFVGWNGGAGALAERLTMGGLEVESVEDVGRLDARVRVGRLVAVERHPDADRLAICRVDVGDAAPVTIVSGAPDLATGRLVTAALPGAVLPGGRTVAAVELRGVASAGMLCSEVELGLGDDASALLELPADAPVGRPLTDVAGVADTVLEIAITANRGDCLSIFGIAREVALLTGAKLRHPRPRPRQAGTAAVREVTVRVEAPDLCPRYCGRVVHDVKPARSPLWLALRLRRAGMRPIGAVVDATNYVMLERGQPLHAFDLDRVADRTIVVRRAYADEKLTTLDGVDRALAPDDLVIADGRTAVALAGVMGGRDSEVTAQTRALLLESAFFTPAGVRRTARRTGIVSQAAYRFERRVDPDMVAEALDAVAALITRIAGGRVAPGIVEAAPGADALQPAAIRFRPRRAAALLGTSLSRAEVLRRLRALGARTKPGPDVVVVTPPSHRGDLAIEEDLIEEVARIGGYDTIPVTLPDAPVASGDDSAVRRFAGRVRRLLVAAGLSEMVTLSFTDAATNAELPGWVGRELRPLPVLNPLSSETGEMRRSPLAGLVGALRLNRDHGAAFVGAFEIGKGYGQDAARRVQEPRAVTVALHGCWPPRGAERSGPALDFFDLKGVVMHLVTGLGVEEDRVRWEAEASVPFLHPGRAARVSIDGRIVGVAGAIHPHSAQVLDLPREVLLAELDFEDLAHYGPRRVGVDALPRFPAVTRDIAMVVVDDFCADDVLGEIRALSDSRIESARLFDCYRGAPIPTGRKSLAYTIAYRAADRTLTDAEVAALHEQVRAHVLRRFPTIELRS
jgi:phenylalanyl-tRNA synthetase beta chain